MEQAELTVNERMALRLWCRQALAKLEQEELKERLLQMDVMEDEHPIHRVSPVRKRPSRNAPGSRSKELAY